MLRAQRQILTASRHLLRQSNPFKPAIARLQHTTSKETRPGIFSPFFSPTAEEQAEEKARGNYPRQTAYDTAKYKTPPTRNKMLVRDFIDDALYNPNYGYFSKQAVIFSPETDFDFNGMRDHLEFMNILGQLYKDIEGEADEVDEVARQVWHTPTELFKVHIGFFFKVYTYILTVFLFIALVWLRYCQISSIRVQVELVSSQRFDYL
jgi:hypothetical protein